MEVDKIDLSLDDIIKLNKKQAKAGGYGQSGRGQRRGRGRGQGQQRGGRGGSSALGKNNRLSLNSGFNRGQRTGRGSLIFRRGGAITAVRGRNRYSPVKKKGISPLNRQNAGIAAYNQQTNRGRLRGQGRTNRGRLRGRGQGQQRFQGQQRGQGQKLGFTSLNRRREQAIQSLLRAKQTLARLNARQQAQQQNRSQLINQRRGLQTSSTNLNTLGLGRNRNRGQGRGRGGRGRGNQSGSGLTRYSSNLSLTSISSQRRGRGRGQQGLNRTFSGSTVSINSIGSQNSRGRRRWRQPNTVQSSPSSLLTISVQNSPPPQSRRRNKLPRYNVSEPDSNPDLQAQIRSLKPAVSTKYNFKKSMFAQAATSTSLSERFSTSQITSPGRQQQNDFMGRKVFY